MRVTVTKAPDGLAYMTKDGHGDLFADDVEPGLDPVVFGDCTVAIAGDSAPHADADALAVRFSYVDYLDTSNRDEPGAGVRSTWERAVPGTFAFGPYTVSVE